jgi:subtilisin family serine protease
MVLASTAALAGSVSAEAATRDANAAASSTSAASAGDEYVVLYREGQSPAVARAVIAGAGGRVVKENTKVGFALATSADPAFAAKVDATGVVEGAARNRVIGSAPNTARADARDVERLPAERAARSGTGGQADAPAAAGAAAAPAPEPLADRQWDMRQIGATATGSYAKDQGSRRVLVGVIDTGIDGTHPDISPNFNGRLSRNFVVDNPVIDGPCEHPSCVDPADEDDDGHGTHVASTIGSPINGLGIAGVAPKVTLVNIRAGQDSGFFFLQPTPIGTSVRQPTVLRGPRRCHLGGQRLSVRDGRNRPAASRSDLRERTSTETGDRRRGRVPVLMSSGGSMG